MQAKTVTQVLVWSRWLRLSHWTLTITTLGLILSGWLISVGSVFAPLATDYHYIFVSLLIPALLLRLYLLFFGKGTDLLSDCEPNAHRLNQAWQVLRFYITLGKAPLPRWYSHNPLWGPIYLAVWFIFTLSAVSGFALMNHWHLIGPVSMSDLHQLCYQLILGFTLLHIPTVFAHDLSSKSSDNSAMIHGYRNFDAGESNLERIGQSRSVSLDTLLKELKK